MYYSTLQHTEPLIIGTYISVFYRNLNNNSKQINYEQNHLFLPTPQRHQVGRSIPRKGQRCLHRTNQTHLQQLHRSTPHRQCPQCRMRSTPHTGRRPPMTIPAKQKGSTLTLRLPKKPHNSSTSSNSQAAPPEVTSLSTSYPIMSVC